MASRLQAVSSLFILSILLVACGSDYLYERSYSIDGGDWTYANNLEFTFDIDDTLSIYNLWLEVDHSTDFGFQNLYTRIHTRFPSGEELSEPLSLELADKVGRWYGDCSSSDCTLKIPIQQGAFFDQTGTYHITVEQFMREDPIRGVNEISFMVEQTGQTR